MNCPRESERERERNFGFGPSSIPGDQKQTPGLFPA
jgi:hypothetical protein